MSEPADDRLDAVESSLGHVFGDRDLLRLALTHPSYNDGAAGTYERLEFLGDAVLGAIVAEELYRRFPEAAEGELTKTRVSLVSHATLAEIGRELGLADVLLLGPSQQDKGARGMSSALADAYEALVAAVFLDGGLEDARRFVRETLGARLDEAWADTPPEHPKSALQEILQARGLAPVYRTSTESGPPHARTFTVEVSDGSDVLGSGTGESKKEAEMRAAAEALGTLRRRR